MQRFFCLQSVTITFSVTSLNRPNVVFRCISFTKPKLRRVKGRFHAYDNAESILRVKESCKVSGHVQNSIFCVCGCISLSLLTTQSAEEIIKKIILSGHRHVKVWSKKCHFFLLFTYNFFNNSIIQTASKRYQHKMMLAFLLFYVWFVLFIFLSLPHPPLSPIYCSQTHILNELVIWKWVFVSSMKAFSVVIRKLLWKITHLLSGKGHSYTLWSMLAAHNSKTLLSPFVKISYQELQALFIHWNKKNIKRRTTPPLHLSART